MPSEAPAAITGYGQPSASTALFSSAALSNISDPSSPEHFLNRIPRTQAEFSLIYHLLEPTLAQYAANTRVVFRVLETSYNENVRQMEIGMVGDEYLVRAHDVSISGGVVFSYGGVHMLHDDVPGLLNMMGSMGVERW